jgi:uncharacterized glyoxalase superfamily protein PhnB
MIYPTLTYRDAHAAIDWLCATLGFERHAVHAGDDGTVLHAELRLGDGIVMLGSDRDDSPFRTGRTVVYAAVDDVDALYERARAAGARILRELADTDYGSRDFAVEDPEGNAWSFGTYRPELTAS